VRKLTSEEFRERVQRIHGDRIWPIEVYINDWEKISFQCQCGHIWKASPSNISQRHGCPVCGHKITSQKKTKTNAQFIEDARQIHGDEIKPLEEYATARHKIKFRCNICRHMWYATPNGILSGTGCPKCAGNFRVY
jgi:predicted  nucleic acid-binding Zn-ribbon protein